MEAHAEGRFSIVVGSSELEFVQRDNEGCFYHFAFNLAIGHFEGAKKYIQSRVPLNIEDNKDEVYFEYANGRAFYFEDPSNNIVEFIVRENFSEEMKGPFSINNLLNIAEISLTTNDVRKHGKKLTDLGIPERDGDVVDPNSLNFMGENGSYLLLGPTGRKWLFSQQFSVPYPITITLGDGRRICLNEKGELELS
ncbi:glyoxalase [Virgibacillus byunsanensis]|uniref:Glyoxalase n=1 Tax=Virgibacillus byunsanensis TaxID=570945 RepID=A0ABW3LSQ9_9BACI